MSALSPRCHWQKSVDITISRAQGRDWMGESLRPEGVFHMRGDSATSASFVVQVTWTSSQLNKLSPVVCATPEKSFTLELHQSPRKSTKAEHCWRTMRWFFCCCFFCAVLATWIQLGTQRGQLEIEWPPKKAHRTKQGFLQWLAGCRLLAGVKTMLGQHACLTLSRGVVSGVLFGVTFNYTCADAHH